MTNQSSSSRRSQNTPINWGKFYNAVGFIALIGGGSWFAFTAVQEQRTQNTITKSCLQILSKYTPEAAAQMFVDGIPNYLKSKTLVGNREGIRRSQIPLMVPTAPTTNVAQCVAVIIAQKTRDTSIDDGKPTLIVGKEVATKVISDAQASYKNIATELNIMEKKNLKITLVNQLVITPPSHSSLNSVAGQHPCPSARRCDRQEIAQAGCKQLVR